MHIYVICIHIHREGRTVDGENFFLFFFIVLSPLLNCALEFVVCSERKYGFLVFLIMLIETTKCCGLVIGKEGHSPCSTLGFEPPPRRLVVLNLGTAPGMREIISCWVRGVRSFNGFSKGVTHYAFFGKGSLLPVDL